MSVVSLSKKAVSTHGLILHRELNATRDCDFDIVKECLESDKLATRLKDADGSNAFHILATKFEKFKTATFALQLLTELAAHCPDGLLAKNNQGNTPLHIYFMLVKTMHSEFTKLLFSSCTAVAALTNNAGETPLLCYLKREGNDMEEEMCKSLCKANPNGPKTPDEQGNLPLHYVLKNYRPNREVVKILLRRYPDSVQLQSSSGSLPLHLVCGASDDLETITMIYNAYPDAMKTTDRHGRTCLHLSALSVGREHSAELRRRENEAKLEEERKTIEAAAKIGAKGGAVRAEDDGDDEEEDDEEEDESILSEKGRSRRHIRWIIDQWPEALTRLNNFQATPVETVLEKTKATKSKFKTVLVFGLYDDPPTARILLTRQKHYSLIKGSGVSALRGRYIKPLQELNWFARRAALLVSLVGEQKPWPVGSTKTNPWGNGPQSLIKEEKLAAKKHSEKNLPNKKKNEILPIPSSNVLARLRRHGQYGPIQIIISYL